MSVNYFCICSVCARTFTSQSAMPGQACAICRETAIGTITDALSVINVSLTPAQPSQPMSHTQFTDLESIPFLNRPQVIDLPGDDLQMVLLVLCAGQAGPATSDKVVAKGSLWIPSAYRDSMPCYIHTQLRFGQRLSLFDCNLISDWGAVVSKEEGNYNETFRLVVASRYWKFRSHEAEGNTWKEALLAAANYVATEGDRLIQALAARAAFLDTEGKEYRDVNYTHPSHVTKQPVLRRKIVRATQEANTKE